jgi:hypothetical protein
MLIAVGGILGLAYALVLFYVLARYPFWVAMAFTWRRLQPALHCAISASPITKRSSLMPANGAIIFRTWSTSSRSSRSSMKSAAGPVSIGSTS